MQTYRRNGLSSSSNDIEYRLSCRLHDTYCVTYASFRFRQQLEVAHYLPAQGIVFVGLMHEDDWLLHGFKRPKLATIFFG